MNKSIEVLFNELENCFAVMVDDTLSFIRIDDEDGESLVELLDSTLCFSQSDIEKVEIGGYITNFWLKDDTNNPYSFQFLYVKELKEPKEQNWTCKCDGEAEPDVDYCPNCSLTNS